VCVVVAFCGVVCVNLFVFGIGVCLLATLCICKGVCLFCCWSVLCFLLKLWKHFFGMFAVCIARAWYIHMVIYVCDVYN